MAEDQTFELITKLYARMEDQFEKIDQRFEKIDQRFDKSDQNMARMEFELKEQIAILHDAVQGNTEQIQVLSSRMEKMEKTIEKHEIKLRIVK